MRNGSSEILMLRVHNGLVARRCYSATTDHVCVQMFGCSAGTVCAGWVQSTWL